MLLCSPITSMPAWLKSAHAAPPPPVPALPQALASRIQAKRLCVGQVDRILHARVPILKFRDISGGWVGG
jgi:hypothetical protein